MHLQQHLPNCVSMSVCVTCCVLIYELLFTSRDPQIVKKRKKRKVNHNLLKIAAVLGQCAIGQTAESNMTQKRSGQTGGQTDDKPDLLMWRDEGPEGYI